MGLLDAWAASGRRVLVEDVKATIDSLAPGAPWAFCGRPVSDKSRGPILGDDPGALDDFRRVFATWDFRNGT